MVCIARALVFLSIFKQQKSALLFDTFQFTPLSCLWLAHATEFEACGRMQMSSRSRSKVLKQCRLEQCVSDLKMDGQWRAQAATNILHL